MTKPSYEELVKANRDLHKYLELYQKTDELVATDPDSMAALRSDMIAAIERAEAAEASLARVRGLLQRQWISVEERLPEKWQRVLVWIYVSPDHLDHFVAWLNSRGEWHDSNGEYRSGSITHWMPLPEPPNSGKTVSPTDSISSEQVDRVITADKSVEYLSQNPNFPQSSSLVSQGAESADIGKLDTADKSGVEMQINELLLKEIARVQEQLDNPHSSVPGAALYIKRSGYCEGLRQAVKFIDEAGSAETGGEKAAIREQVRALCYELESAFAKSEETSKFWFAATYFLEHHITPGPRESEKFYRCKNSDNLHAVMGVPCPDCKLEPEKLNNAHKEIFNCQTCGRPRLTATSTVASGMMRNAAQYFCSCAALAESSLSSPPPDGNDQYLKSSGFPHKTVPVPVLADIDEEVASLVAHLNTIDGVRTHAACQGTIGQGGPNPYRAYVMVSWTPEALKRLRSEFEVAVEGNGTWGYVYPTFRESSSPAEQGAESVHSGKQNTADKAGLLPTQLPKEK